MAYQQKERADIKEKIVKVLRQSLSDEETIKSELRILSWIVNEKVTPVKLERRDFWKDKEGVWKPGKCRGLYDSDVIFILEHGVEIGRYMGFNADKFAAKPEAEPVPF